MRVTSRELFFPEEGPGVTVRGLSYYTRARGFEKARLRATQSSSDRTDIQERSFSSDNGRTWSPAEPIQFISRSSRGTLRDMTQPPFVDPVEDRLVQLVVRALLPTDDPLEGLLTRHLYYAVSLDGGRTLAVREQVIQQGRHDAEHPLEGVWVGRSSASVGDRTCRPIRTREGSLLFPIQIAPAGPDGSYTNPGGGYTYGESAVLIASWDADCRLRWELSSRVALDPSRSTRGAIEPTIAETLDGRIAMVMRGSNDVRPQLPGHKWISVSPDGGRSWSQANSWTFDDGEPFHSPSSCSQLLRHSGGTLYWLGNVCPGNPRGNSPRYPLVIGIVDEPSLLLRKETLVVVDDRGPGDSERLGLSNLMAHEDRETREILLHMSRPFSHGPEERASAAYLYRIEP